MKKLYSILFVAAGIILFSCNSTRYQIVETKAVGSDVTYKADDQEIDLKTAEKLNHINKLEYPTYENADLKITYTFWSKGGKMSYKLYNKTDKVMYVDFRESRFIKNGQNIDYYTENTKTIEYTEAKPQGCFGGCTALFSKAAIKKADIGVNKKYDRVLAIAPKSFIMIDTEFGLMDVRFNPLCGFTIPLMDKSISKEFTRANTPLYFRNFLSYTTAKDGATKTVDNEFYVSKVTNMKPKMYKGEKLKVKRCEMTQQLNKYQLAHTGKVKLNNYITYTYPYDKPSNFYFIYLQTKKK